LKLASSFSSEADEAVAVATRCEMARAKEEATRRVRSNRIRLD